VTHLWRCAMDGLEWRELEHQRRLSLTGGLWRGHPASMDPWRQWCRENLAHSRNGIVYCADDGIIRSYQPGSADLGYWLAVEHKAHSDFNLRRLTKDVQTLRATMVPGRASRPVLIACDRDVPSPLAHWPAPCPACEAPGPKPEASERVVVYIIGAPGQDHEREEFTRPTSVQLRRWLYGFMQHKEAS
jgi:hypothetical protein